MTRKSPDPITALPFVSPRALGEPGRFPRGLWSVKPTGDIMEDSTLGHEYALAFLRYEATQDHNLAPYLLPWIVADMPHEQTQIEVSFLTIVAIAASAGVQAAEGFAVRWKGSLDTLRARSIA